MLLFNLPHLKTHPRSPLLTCNQMIDELKTFYLSLILKRVPPNQLVWTLILSFHTFTSFLGLRYYTL